MAARRLIIVLVVLFTISVVAALIAPDRRGTLLGGRTEQTSTTTSSTTTTSTTTTDELPPGAALNGRIDASAGKPQSVDADVGDQLQLSVTSDRSRLVEIPAFGVVATAAPEAPARFNLLLRQAGRLPIRDADTGALLGRIDVAQPRGKGN